MSRLVTKVRAKVGPRPASQAPASMDTAQAGHTTAAAFPHPPPSQEPRSQPRSPAWHSGYTEGRARSTGSECHERHLPGQLVHLKLGLFRKNYESACLSCGGADAQVRPEVRVIPRHPWLLKLAV